MKRFFLILAVIALLAGTVAAQVSAEKVKHNNELLAKLHQVELLAQIMPVGMTKDQLNKVLPVLEKIRADQQKVQAMEADELLKLEASVDSAIKDAIEKGATPSSDILGQMQKLAKALSLSRMIVLEDNAVMMLAELKKILNSGQLAVMTKTIEAKAINPAKPEDVKDDDRTKAYIKSFLFDPAAYDLLVKLSM